jgi:hypothetical protein
MKIQSLLFRALLNGHGLCATVGVAVVASLMASPAQAAQTGELTGYVFDAAGNPAVDVRVTLTSPQLIGGPKVDVTNVEGKFRFSQLDPGRYTVLMSNVAFIALEEKDIEVSADSTTTREYLLEPAVQGGTGTEVVKVTATRPMVDTTRTMSGASFKPEFTDRINTARSYQDIATLTPGVSGSAGAAGNPTIHGGTYQSNMFQLDGMNISDPVTQTFAANFNFDSIGELEVLTGGMDAEYGGVTGGIVNIITKSGGDDFTVDASVYWQPSQLLLSDKGEVNNSNDLTANLAVGGPIIRKKLWFFLSGQFVNSTSQTPVIDSPFFEADRSLVWPSRNFLAFYGLGKVKWQAAPWQKVSLMLQGDPTFIINDDDGGRPYSSIHPDALEQRFQGGGGVLLTSETTLSDALFLKAQIGYRSNELFIFPMKCPANYEKCQEEGTPGRTNQGTGTATISDSTLTNDRRYRVTLNTALSYFLEGVAGDHEFKLGLQGDATWFREQTSAPGGRSYSDSGIVSPNSNVAGAGDPFQVTIYNEPLDKTVTGQGAALYVQDTWRLFKNLTIKPGVRFDSATSSNDVGTRIYWFNTVSPRVGVAWDPFSDGKTLLRGGYYFYNENGLLTVPSFVGRGLKSETYEYDPITNDYTKFVRREGGDSAVAFKDNMRAPNMHEVQFGAQREIFDNAAILVDFTYRRTQNQFEDDESNVIWNKQGNSALGFRNGEQRFIYSVGTPDEAMREYVGVDVTFNKRLADNWQVFTTYTLSQLKGTTERYVSYAFDNPTQRPYEFGFTEDDVRHSMEFSASYDFPLGFQLGGTAVYSSGRPLGKYFLNTFYGTFDDKRAPYGYDPKNVEDLEDDVEIRRPAVFAVDIRATWRLKELTGQDIWLIGDVSNLLNNRTPAATEAYEQRDVADFGKQLTKATPTNATLAVRYMF